MDQPTPQTPPQGPLPDPGDVPPSESRALVVAAGVFEGGLVFVAALLGWLLGEAPLPKIAWTPPALAIGLGASLPPLVALAVFVHYPIWPWAGLVRVVDQLLAPLFRACTVTELAMISVLAGLGEEMLFRGVLQDALARWIDGPHGIWIALAAVSVVFGVLHWLTPFYALMAGLIGAYLGWLWIATGNLLVPVAAHAAYDFVALVYLAKIRGASREP